MSDRLDELQRQRALVQEQLAWLDREIARESGGQASPATAAKSPVTEPRKSSAPIPDAEAILARYGGQNQNAEADVKRGCFIAFFAALALLALTVTAIWFFRYRR